MMDNKVKIENFKKVLISALVLGLITYAYVFFNFTPAHDGMMTIKINQYWEMSVGRFGALYYGKMRGVVEAPWLIGVITLLFYAGAIYLTLDVLKIRFDYWKIAIVSMVYLLNIAFIANACVYIFCLDVLACALFLAVLSLWCFVRIDNIWGFLISALIMAFSLGLYQSYITAAIGIYVILSISNLSENDKVAKVIKKGLLYLASIILSGLFYLLLVKIFQFLSGVKSYQGDAYESLGNLTSYGILDYIKLVPICYKQVFRYYFINNIYSAKWIILLNIVIAVMAVYIWICFITKKINYRTGKILAALLVLLFPLVINGLCFLTKGNVVQMITFPYQLLYILMLFPLLKYGNDISVIKKVNMCHCAIVIMVVISFFVIRFANDIFYYQKLVGEGTQASMINIVYDIERNKDFEPDTTEIVMVGDQTTALGQNYEFRWVYGNVSGVGTSGTTVTYNTTFYWYMRYILGRDYKINSDQEVVEKIKQTTEYKNMNVYPHDGYCGIIDGYMVIKFTE
ncbi:Glucosyl transferase GtrII [Butyrivibrio hungatei DSM 14810]|uniref:Glucosyl transferase GtrII n=1 Tax=Butyrivibrio hungatei DSM 14810 TaxID=1121132 RepID=A0A1M7T509_9FIRM|nr:glucosyltransferase domain-containing protein [Butyrivibrio hungatei]SHN65781.1 Glucosyl transferase GtrII [Butyrivibrio hungatei DSM 14810]